MRIFIAAFLLGTLSVMPVLADDSVLDILNADTDVVEVLDVDSDFDDETPDPDEVQGDVDMSDAELVEIILDDGIPTVEELEAELEKYWQEYMAELEDNAQAMRDKEQSLENRILGAAAMGASGLGGMQAMSAMAEERADAAAERDMRAYLATFTCEYGDGKRVAGGETNVELPTSAEMTSLYAEYTSLASDLKERKAALGMRAGIESETIIDPASTGLYDNVGVGRADGAYTSLSRAITDNNSADAAQWEKQKSETAEKKKQGMTMVGVANAGAVVANKAINGKNKEKSDQITAEYKKKIENARATNDAGNK